MTTPSLLDSVQQHLGPDTIQQIGTTLGLDPATTASAVSMALPVILGGLTNNAATPDGAASLTDALAGHDGSILDNIGGLLRNPAGAAGAAILGHIFGRHQAPVEEGVAKASGISASQVTQLLMMLAPIVMGVLGRMKQQHGLGPEQIPQVLNQSNAAAQSENPILAGLGRMQSGSGELGSVLGGLFGQK